VRLELELTVEQLDTIAARAADLVAGRETADGWLRGADKIAAYIDAPESRVYALSSSRRIPVHRDGSALVAKRSELDTWLCKGGGVRP
jgi:hypothetical protein